MHWFLFVFVAISWLVDMFVERLVSASHHDPPVAVAAGIDEGSSPSKIRHVCL